MSTVPQLDTIDFEQLVLEARGHIPRYAPGWTDHNLHDPGVTLIDLLAWIVDQQIYRVGFVSDRLREAFAALLGAESAGPKAARGLIWPDQALVAGRTLHAGAEVICLRRPDIGFVLEHDLFATDAELVTTTLVRGDERLSLSLSAPTSASVVLAPTEPGGEVALVMRFDRPLVGQVELPVSLGFDVDAWAEPSAPGRSWGPLQFDYRVGDGDWTEVVVVADNTSALAISGTVLLRVVQSPSSESSELRLLLDRGYFPFPPRLRRLALNVLPIVQHELDDELDGRPEVIADGRPGLEVALDSRELVPSSPGAALLTANVGQDAWTEVADFERSRPEDPHYVRLPTKLVFGNGVNGRRPPTGAKITVESFARTKGPEGNLQAGFTWAVPKLSEGANVFGRNAAPIAGGAFAESSESLLATAREVATSRLAMLTDEELANAARGLAGFGVARVDVLPGYDRALPTEHIVGVRTVVVVPRRDRRVAAVEVTPQYLDAVSQALADRRVLGERLIVTGPHYEPVDVDLSIVVEPGAQPAAVEAALRARLENRLSDLSFDDAVAPWQFGRPVTVEEMKTVAANVEGVLAVPGCRIGRSGAAAGHEPVTVPANGIALAASITVTAALDFEELDRP